MIFQLMQVHSQPNIGLSQQQQPSQTHDIPVNSQGNNLGLGRAACKRNKEKDFVQHLKLNNCFLFPFVAGVQANSQSFGFFIAQDSMFGNNILPVLPRQQPNPTNK